MITVLYIQWHFCQKLVFSYNNHCPGVEERLPLHLIEPKDRLPPLVLAVKGVQKAGRVDQVDDHEQVSSYRATPF